MKYRFLRDYNHRWPSRASTQYLKGMELHLKREVISYALGRGIIEEVPGSDRSEHYPAAVKPRGRK